MSKNYFSILIIPFVLFGLSCCSKPYGIRFDNAIYDFGEMEEGTDVKHTYVFTNTGTETLIIQHVQPSCGCTTAYDWDRSVVPGARGKIPITFKAQSFNGEVSKIINVQTNIPERPGDKGVSSPKKNFQLTLKGRIVIPVEIVPLNAWLGEIGKETKTLEGSFDIKNNTKTPLKILEVVPPDPRVEFRLTTVEENKRYKLDYSMNAPFDGLETVAKQFTLRTNIDRHENVYAKFFYFVPPPLRVYPLAVSVDTTRLSRANIYEINVKSSMDLPIKVLDPALHGGKGISYILKEITKDKYYQVQMKFTPDFVFPEEKIYFTFRVQNDPKKAIYNIPVESSSRAK